MLSRLASPTSADWLAFQLRLRKKVGIDGNLTFAPTAFLPTIFVSSGQEALGRTNGIKGWSAAIRDRS